MFLYDYMLEKYNLIFKHPYVIHFRMGPDSSLLSITPDPTSDDSYLSHLDFPVKSLVEMVQFNQITTLRDSSTDSPLSVDSAKLYTPPSSPLPYSDSEDPYLALGTRSCDGDQLDRSASGNVLAKVRQLEDGNMETT